MLLHGVILLPYAIPCDTSLLINNQVIMEVESHKYLVFLPNDCSWHKHFDYVYENAWGRINDMRRLDLFLARKSTEAIILPS